MKDKSPWQQLTILIHGGRGNGGGLGRGRGRVGGSRDGYGRRRGREGGAEEGGAERRLRRRGGRSGRGQGSKKLGEMGVANVRPLTHSSTHQSLSPVHTHTHHSLRK